MAEESDLEKTEPASERRLEKAREDGNVARSRELNTLVLLGTAIAGLWMSADSLGRTMQSAIAGGLGFDRATAFDTSHMLIRAGEIILQVLLSVASP